MSMTDGELDEIITLHWPRVMRQVMADGSDEWLKGFVRSIARHAKRSSWRPSAKQEAIMRRLMAETAPTGDDVIDLIER